MTTQREQSNESSSVSERLRESVKAVNKENKKAQFKSCFRRTSPVTLRVKRQEMELGLLTHRLRGSGREGDLVDL